MAKAEPQVNVNSISRISSGTFFKGEMTSSSDIRLDGRYEGKLYTDGKVVVGETAELSGDTVCTNVDIWGKVSGNVIVKDVTSLKAGCSMNGNLQVRKLIVELGSIFNGTCRMITVEEYDKLSKDYRPEKKQEQPQQPRQEKK